jgi:uncharacterized protein YjiS (DUF1127 family)
MAAIATLWPSRSAHAGSEGFSTPLRSARRMLHEMLSRRRTYAHLGSLDDRMLRDIGLHRSEIEPVAFNPNRRPARSR